MQSTTQHVTATGGQGLWLHTDPGLSTDLIAVVPEGDAMTALCFGYADAVVSPISTVTPSGSTSSPASAKAGSVMRMSTRRWSTVDDLVAVGIPSCDESGSDTVESSAPESTTPQSSSGWMPYCGPSEYLEGIEVEPWAEVQFKIVVYPTAASRTNLDPWHVTEQMWYAIQDCVSDLYGPLADSIWDQLECHQHLALCKLATGPTYDLESWHGTFGVEDWIDSHCGNHLGTEPDGPLGPPIAPDTGQSDLYEAYNNIA